MDKLKITKRVVDAASPPTSGERRIWDSEIAGFCLRIYPPSLRPGAAAPTARKVFAVKYRVKGVQRWLNLGEYGDGPGKLTPDEARKAAGAVIVDARRGIDASETRKREDGLTVTDLIERYLKEGPRDKADKRASSWASDRTNLERHVSPLIGTKRAADVDRDDINSMVADITTGKTARDVKTGKRGRSIVTGGAAVADRAFSITRAMFNWSIDKGLIDGPNPCAKIKRRILASVERFLSDEEAQRLIVALAGLEAEGAITPQQASIFRLLLLTGARRAEIAGLRWSEVDYDRKRIDLPISRTKAGGKNGERRIPLNAPAIAILKDLERTRTARAVYVFPATKGKSGHTTSEAKVWREKVITRAKLPGLRIHDLRHSFASFALADGASLYLIGKALGHASSRTTERYAHLADDPVRDMAETVGKRFERPET